VSQQQSVVASSSIGNESIHSVSPLESPRALGGDNGSIATTPPKVLFLVEGNTDIRFVTGLSQISSLSIAVPARAYNESGLKHRIAASGVSLRVHELPSGRIRFQLSSLRYLIRHAREFDVILCQEVLRGALSGTLAGKMTNTPVISYMCIAPVEYFRCRYERRQSGWLKTAAGTAVIRTLMYVNGKLASRCVALGPYLIEIARRYCSRTVNGLYYGVNTSYYRPVSEVEKSQLRTKLDLPRDAFIILLSSRVSHEKDPETVLRAITIARSRGLPAVLLNLGGGYRDFLSMVRRLLGPEAVHWVMARPAVHPMAELAGYYQAADCLAQASLSEGLGLSPLEALACGVPTVCTAVGGLKANLEGYARLVPRCDPDAMAAELLWVSENMPAARAQALAGRDFVMRAWSRERAFEELSGIIESVRRWPNFSK